MSELSAKCAVTLQPTMTVERLPVLADAILNKLWPDNAGGVVWLQRPKLVKMLEPLQEFVARTKVPQQFWVHRDGVTLSFKEA